MIMATIYKGKIAHNVCDAILAANEQGGPYNAPIVDRLCEKIERFYYDTLTKRIDKNERNNNHPSSLQ